MTALGSDDARGRRGLRAARTCGARRVTCSLARGTAACQTRAVMDARWLFVAALSALCSLGGCKPSAPEAPRSVSDRAQELFSSRCVPCHGPQGRGDGAAAAGLTPRPRDFTDPVWHARATDEHLRRLLSGGGSAVGLSGMMPPNPELATDTALRDALVAHVRTLMRRR